MERTNNNDVTFEETFFETNLYNWFFEIIRIKYD